MARKKQSIDVTPPVPAPSVAGAVPESPAPKAVEAKSQKLVQVEYLKENHHILDGVHAVRKGINHLPAHVWEKAKSHPSIQKLMDDGHLIDLDEEKLEEDASGGQAAE